MSHVEIPCDDSRHSKWAVSTANHRTRATLQIYKYLSGEIPRLPQTAVEIYGQLVNQSAVQGIFGRLEEI